MIKLILESISEAHEFISETNHHIEDATFTSQIERLYHTCREIKITQRALLDNRCNISISIAFTEIENKLHEIFFKTMKRELNSTFSWESDQERSLIFEIGKMLHTQNDSATSELIKKLSEPTQDLLYKNLYKILGSPLKNPNIGKSAFLHTDGQSASTTDKLDAILCSMDQLDAIHLCIHIKNIDFLKISLPPEHEISLHDLGLAIRKACVEESVTSLRYLLSHTKEHNPYHLAIALELATQKNYFTCIDELLSNTFVNELLSNENTVLLKSLDDSVIRASENGLIISLRSLLSSRFASSVKSLTPALHLATRNGHIECVDYLLSLDMKFTNEDLGKAVIFACEKNAFKCLQSLLSANREIPIEYLAKSIQNAAKNDYFNCLHLLLSTTKTIPSQYLENVLSLTAYCGHLRIFKEIWQKVQISPEKFGDILIYASDCGKWAIVCFLLQTGYVVKESIRDSAIQRADERGYQDIIDLLRGASDRRTPIIFD